MNKIMLAVLLLITLAAIINCLAPFLILFCLLAIVAGLAKWNNGKAGQFCSDCSGCCLGLLWRDSDYAGYLGAILAGCCLIGALATCSGHHPIDHFPILKQWSMGAINYAVELNNKIETVEKSSMVADDEIKNMRNLVKLTFDNGNFNGKFENFRKVESWLYDNQTDSFKKNELWWKLFFAYAITTVVYAVLCWPGVVYYLKNRPAPTPVATSAKP